MVACQRLNVVSAYRQLRGDARRALPLIKAKRDSMIAAAGPSPWPSLEVQDLNRLIDTIEAPSMRRKP